MFLTSLIVAVFSTPYAFANGGPVAWTTATPRGNLLLKGNDIELISEQLDIKLNADFKTFDVRAEYKLKNEKSPKEIDFGVPISWYPEEGMDGDVYSKAELKKYTAKTLEDATRIAKSIKISMGANTYSCKVVPSPKNYSLTKPEAYDISVNSIKSWCLAKLPIPKSGEISVTLTYIGTLWYQDSAFSKSALTEFESRNLSYLLFPAGYWKGPVKSLNVNVDLGEFIKYATAKEPQQSAIIGSKITWAFKDVDLKTIPQILISLDPTPARFLELAAWNKLAVNNSKADISAKATGELAASSKINYSAKNLVDGDIKTAWCAAKGAALQNSVLQFTSKKRPIRGDCSFEGLIVAAGYLKDAIAFANNIKIKKIEIKTCDEKLGFTRSLKTDQTRFEALNFVKNEHEPNKDEPVFDAIDKSGCFKLEILEVNPPLSKSADTCISEVAVVINCG